MVRAFQTGDLNRVTEIWLEANLQAHGFIPRGYWEGQLEAVRTLLPQAELYVWQDGDSEVQGFIGLSGEHIEGIFVWPQAQSRGIGRALLQRAKSAHGRLTLHVYRKNDRASALYRREAFRAEWEGLDEATGEMECRMAWERLKTVFLDLDDTILDFSRAEAEALRRALTELDAPADEGVLARYHEINAAQWELLEEGVLTREQVLLGRFDILFGELGLRRSARELCERYEGYLAEGHWFIPGAEELLETLAPRYDLYLASNGTAEVQYRRLESAGIRRYFRNYK